MRKEFTWVVSATGRAFLRYAWLRKKQKMGLWVPVVGRMVARAGTPRAGTGRSVQFSQRIRIGDGLVTDVSGMRGEGWFGCMVWWYEGLVLM